MLAKVRIFGVYLLCIPVVSVEAAAAAGIAFVAIGTVVAGAAGTVVEVAVATPIAATKPVTIGSALTGAAGRVAGVDGTVYTPGCTAAKLPFV